MPLNIGILGWVIHWRNVVQYPNFGAWHANRLWALSPCKVRVGKFKFYEKSKPNY